MAPSRNHPKRRGPGMRAAADEHRGSSLDDFLQKDGSYEEVHAAALKLVVVRLIEEGMIREGITKPEMARRMGTSRSQLDRVLDPLNVTIQLDTLFKAARAVGRSVGVTFQPLTRSARSS